VKSTKLVEVLYFLCINRPQTDSASNSKPVLAAGAHMTNRHVPLTDPDCDHLKFATTIFEPNRNGARVHASNEYWSSSLSRYECKHAAGVRELPRAQNRGEKRVPSALASCSGVHQQGKGCGPPDASQPSQRQTTEGARLST
jgi:hypothetical protein